MKVICSSLRDLTFMKQGIFVLNRARYCSEHMIEHKGEGEMADFGFPGFPRNFHWVLVGFGISEIRRFPLAT